MKTEKKRNFLMRLLANIVCGLLGAKEVTDDDVEF
jgi:hypothetical protein